MPYVLTAQTVRLVSRPYSFQGREGVSHKATLADGDDLITVKIPEDVYDRLSPEVLTALASVGYVVEIALDPPRVFTNERGATLSIRARDARLLQVAEK